MMIDSLEMTDADRQVILEQCRKTREERIVATHGPLQVREFRRVVQSGERSGIRADIAARRLCGDERTGFPLGRLQEGQEDGGV